jgi:hypothetical protein
MAETTVPIQESRLTRREVFENKQAEHMRRFELREKVAANYQAGNCPAGD